jgi:hypothetical protein
VIGGGGTIGAGTGSWAAADPTTIVAALNWTACWSVRFMKGEELPPAHDCIVQEAFSDREGGMLISDLPSTRNHTHS